MEKLKNPELHKWYARKTVENGWSRNILVAQIETRLHERIGQATNNFELALPPTDSDMASHPNFKRIFYFYPYLCYP